mmetsp:Transcript_23134/g.65558  ORF Transcript_23134/g.65558 Transcript_23134/m.65558 type:complete len:87 (+) Transcript_23134:1227-1487(+)
MEVVDGKNSAENADDGGSNDDAVEEKDEEEDPIMFLLNLVLTWSDPAEATDCPSMVMLGASLTTDAAFDGFFEATDEEMLSPEEDG